MTQQMPWIAGALVTIALVAGIVMFDSKQNAPVNTELPADIVSIKDGEWVKGDASAPVTIIEYSDFQCPACGAYYPMIKKVLDQEKEKVRFVYRQYPLVSLHPNGLAAARAAEAAGAQGKFFEFHDQLFEHQTEWSPEKDPSGRFDEYAKAIGLDIGRFNTDRKGDAIDNAVNEDRKSGDKAGVSSTPTFIINGKLITENPKTIDAFIELINQAAGLNDTPTPQNNQ